MRIMRGRPTLQRPSRFAFAIALVATACVGGTLAAAADGGSGSVPVVQLHGVMTTGDADRLTTAIASAASAGSPCVVLDIDSPGGTAGAISAIVNAELGSQIPVVAYVGPQAHALSGALAVAEAASVVAVAPTALVGTDHPLIIDQSSIPSLAATTAPAVAQLATEHGRAGTWLATLATSPATLDGATATARHIADITESGVDAVLTRINGTTIGSASASQRMATAGATTEAVAPEGWDGFVKQMANPDVAYMLLIVAVLSIGIFIAHPGAFVVGIAGLFAGIAAVVGFANLPVNGIGIIFIAISFALFVVDIRATTHGALTAAGAVAMAIGGWRLVDTSTLNAGVSMILVVITVTGITGAYGILVPKLVAARRMPWGDPQAELVGRVGTVSERLGPSGYISLDGVLWQAVATHSPQPRGASVRVVEAHGLRLTVSPTDLDHDV